jgi:hypothetical protein
MNDFPVAQEFKYLEFLSWKEMTILSEEGPGISIQITFHKSPRVPDLYPTLEIKTDLQIQTRKQYAVLIGYPIIRLGAGHLWKGILVLNATFKYKATGLLTPNILRSPTGKQKALLLPTFSKDKVLMDTSILEFVDKKKLHIKDFMRKGAINE